MQTFLFYDIESTGLNKSFDQVLQFAGIRTDKDLNEIERYELKVKLNPDIIPSPFATITHRISVKNNQDNISEYEAIKKIHSWINQPNTKSLGYNTLGFDDEFLRFSFFKNLLPPYSHQYANNCGRLDLYPMTAMYYLFKNEILNWPKIENKISLKLEQLNNANNLAKGQAHDAMVDVEATLKLAREFKKESKMWDYLIGFFNKNEDIARSNLLKNSPALYFNGYLGHDNNFQCPVIFLGQHKYYKNQSIWLRLDSTKLIETTQETIQNTTQIIRKKPGEPGFLLPIKKRYLNYLTKERLDQTEINELWLKNNSETLKAIASYHTNFIYPTYQNVDIDSSLYLNGFKNSNEEKFCRDFHKAPDKEKTKIIDKAPNQNLKKQAIRILGRNFPENLSQAQLKEFNIYLKDINPLNEIDTIIDFQNNKKLTIDKALQQIIEIKAEIKLDSEQHVLLNELEDYLTNFKSHIQ
ncbi:exonuclease domain-containing protein [Gammaproteobacteria bacterium]|nr:exonuclease domain-containing protein [Gammaproteobacteria bacterium]